MTPLAVRIILAMLATCGFSIIFRVPVRKIPVCIIIGAIGLLIYQFSVNNGASPVISCFLASFGVGLLSDIGARIFKEAATIFIIPGILCLVPGSNIYNTMFAFLNHDMDKTAAIGTETLLMAGAIAAGLLTVGYVTRVLQSVKRRASARGR